MDYWMVKLAGSGYRRPFGELRHVCDDTCCRIDHPSWLCTGELSGLPSDSIDNGHPWMHQQYAYKVDREIQFSRINVQHNRTFYCDNHDSSCNKPEKSRAPQIYSGEGGMGKLLRRYRFFERGRVTHDFRGCHMDDEVGSMDHH